MYVRKSRVTEILKTSHGISWKGKSEDGRAHSKNIALKTLVVSGPSTVHVEGQHGPYKAALQNSSAMQIFKLQRLVMLGRTEYKFAKL